MKGLDLPKGSIFFLTLSYNCSFGWQFRFLVCLASNVQSSRGKAGMMAVGCSCFPPTLNSRKQCKRRRKTKDRHPQRLSHSDTLLGVSKTEPCVLHFLAKSIKWICNFELLHINHFTYSQLAKRLISPTPYITVIYSEMSLNVNWGWHSLHPRGCPSLKAPSLFL